MKLFRRLKKSLFPSEHKKTLRQWRNDGGDERLRYDYDLTEKSIVLDVGGFEGEWADKIFQRYGCRIHIFEPVTSFYEIIRKIFAGNSQVSVYGHGLGGSNRKEEISVDENASSIYKSNGNREEIEIVDIMEWLDQNEVAQVDLIKINIEGGEFELLEKLIQVNALPRFRNIQVQFHSFTPDAVNRMNKIHTALAKTHRATYIYRFIWENWERI